MKYWLIAALLLPACKKKTGPTKAGASTNMKKPEHLMTGKAKQRLRHLELQCTVEVAPESNHVWVSISVINHGSSPHFVPSPTDEVWAADQGGRALYTVGSPKRYDLKPPKAPVYATIAPKETRTWMMSGAKSVVPLADGPAHDFKCSVSQGPDGTQYLHAGARALDVELRR